MSFDDLIRRKQEEQVLHNQEGKDAEAKNAQLKAQQKELMDRAYKYIDDSGLDQLIRRLAKIDGSKWEKTEGISQLVQFYMTLRWRSAFYIHISIDNDGTITIKGKDTESVIPADLWLREPKELEAALVKAYEDPSNFSEPWEPGIPTPLEPGYKILMAEYQYRIHDESPPHHSQLVTIGLKTLHKGVEFFKVRYSWSGKGRVGQPQIISDGHKALIGPPYSNSASYYIYLGRELKAGVETTIKYLQDFYDDEETFVPRLSKTIIEPTDKLILRVKMSRAPSPTGISYFEKDSKLPDKPVISQKAGRYDYQKGEIRWEISKLTLGHQYVISWSYPEHAWFPILPITLTKGSKKLRTGS